MALDPATLPWIHVRQIEDYWLPGLLGRQSAGWGGRGVADPDTVVSPIREHPLRELVLKVVCLSVRQPNGQVAWQVESC